MVGTATTDGSVRKRVHEETEFGLPMLILSMCHHMLNIDTISAIVIIISNNKRNSITITVFIIFSCNYC